MEDSILKSTKLAVGVEPSYSVFDQQLIMNINSVFGTLNQLGVGPPTAFEIEDETPTWSDFFAGRKNLGPVKSYMQLRVRLLFDPPTVGFVLTAMQEQIKELEWRLNVERESTDWVDPNGLTEPSPGDPTVPTPNLPDEELDGFIDGQSFELIYKNARI